MAEHRPMVEIRDSRFIFQTNFSGDPGRDRFGNTERKANLIIPDPDTALELRAMGFNVRETHPIEGEEEGFVPEYFVAVKANMDSNWPPAIYLVYPEQPPIQLDADTLGEIDFVHVDNVKAVLNPYYSERNGTWSFYIRTMYVEASRPNDPFAQDYM